MIRFLMAASVILAGLATPGARAGDDRYYGSSQSREITCESRDGRQNYCEVETRGGVRLVRQYSDAACVRGSSWNYDRRGIWVSRGCRARFEVGGYESGWGPGAGQGARQITCESRDERQNFCSADTRGGVRLVRQYSDAACVRGRSWDYDRRGIWVSRGCRARFEIAGGGHGGYPGNGHDNGYGRQTVRCESRNKEYRFCPVSGGLRDARLVRRLSDEECREGYSWGQRRDGIWVDRGCRAEFEVR